MEHSSIEWSDIHMINRMAFLVTGMLIGMVIAISYEDEIDEMRYRTNRCCKKVNRKIRNMQSYLE